MTDDRPDGYTVRWTGLTLDGRYEVVGPVEAPPTMFLNFGVEPAPWREYTWTLRGARRAIRNHKRSKQVVYRESA